MSAPHGTGHDRILAAVPHLCGISTGKRLERKLIMIRAFIDDSEQGSHLLMAGWVADVKTWESFSDDWSTALNGAPGAIQYFNHHEAKSATGQFDGWEPQAIDSKMGKLVDVICGHGLMYGVSCDLDIDVHNAAFSGAIVSRKVLKSALKLTHAYHSCVFAIHATVLQIQIDNGQRGRVDLIYDENIGMMGECIEQYSKIKQYFPEDKKAISGIMTEANDRDVDALQAADLLAGQLTTARRLQRPEEHYRRMWAAHPIYYSSGYLPDLDKVPVFINYFNVVWSTQKITRSGVGRK